MNAYVSTYRYWEYGHRSSIWRLNNTLLAHIVLHTIYVNINCESISTYKYWEYRHRSSIWRLINTLIVHIVLHIIHAKLNCKSISTVLPQKLSYISEVNLHINAYQSTYQYWEYRHRSSIWRLNSTVIVHIVDWTDTTL